MPSSKLDYLSSKYTSNAASKKKKKKKSKSKNDADDMLPPPPVADDQDDHSDGDQGPTVVDSAMLSSVNPTLTSHQSSEDEENRPGRRRHDSSTSEEEAPVTRLRHDSSSSEDRSSNRRRRHDSSDDDSAVPAPTKRRHDSSSSDEASEPKHKQTMSSGHSAGLQTGRDFAKKESKIQDKRQGEAQEMVEKYGIGETVYRPKNDTSKPNKKPRLTDAERIQLQTGRAQFEQAELAKQEFEKIQESSFARRSDDAELEDLRKREIRPDDPMAQYAVRQQQTSSELPSRPVYKGPPAKPNRFHIRPGHRWDAVDRGNGFEDRLLAQHASAHHKRQREYQNSALDM